MQNSSVASVLSPVTSTVLVVPQGLFVVEDHFKTSLEAQPEIPFAWVEHMFRQCFNPEDRVTDEYVAMGYSELKKPCSDGMILDILGGVKRVLSRPAQIYALLVQKKRRGDAGLISAEGTSTFYVRDRRKKVWTVNICWHGGRGWMVSMSDVKNPHLWNPGRRVFFPQSLISVLGGGIVAYGR
ncbi:MAG: hypothetical protein HYT15_04655 [Candidatus Magasanikbacteria bacterium]|nr:hypothetical protein [Candidatus Magasanikbacteria bacterium]